MGYFVVISFIVWLAMDVYIHWLSFSSILHKTFVTVMSESITLLGRWVVFRCPNFIFSTVAVNFRHMESLFLNLSLNPQTQLINRVMLCRWFLIWQSIDSQNLIATIGYVLSFHVDEIVNVVFHEDFRNWMVSSSLGWICTNLNEIHTTIYILANALLLKFWKEKPTVCMYTGAFGFTTWTVVNTLPRERTN